MFWEHVLWLVNISAELEIVDFSNITFVKILSKEELVKVLCWWDNFKLLEDTSELLGSNVAALCSIVVLELRLNQHTLVDNFSSDGRE